MRDRTQGITLSLSRERDANGTEMKAKKKLGSKKMKKKFFFFMKVSSRPHVCCTHSHYTELFAFCLNAFELKASILSHSVVVLSRFFCFHLFHTLALFLYCRKRTFTRIWCDIIEWWIKSTAHLSLALFLPFSVIKLYDAVFFLYSSIPSTIEILYFFLFCCVSLCINACTHHIHQPSEFVYSMKLYWMCDYISLMNRENELRLR